MHFWVDVFMLDTKVSPQTKDGTLYANEITVGNVKLSEPDHSSFG